MNQAQIPVSDANPYDVFVIGGGINGVGIARDAAGRGLSVYLCEKGDLAMGTSSASTKLIHGGLRYLEFYEFRLVREALQEREILLKSAPHIIWPVEFVLPHSPNLRSIWLVRLGLFLYDHLARRRRMHKSYHIDLRKSRFGRPLKSYVREGFVYSDCWVEDSRLVVLTAQDAAKRGAVIEPYTQFVRAEKENDLWRIRVQPENGASQILYARNIVNAAGPGLNAVAKRIFGEYEQPHPLRLVKGSHLVVPKLYEGAQAYILQQPDRRMVFAIPFGERFSLIGTTDRVADESETEAPKISEGEVEYLLDAVNMYFNQQLTPQSILHTYSGVRPLFDDGEAESRKVTRDYKVTLDNGCLSVFGGKITTFRRLAEEAVDKILASMGRTAPHWTEEAILPGGNFKGTLEQFTQAVQETYPFLPPEMARRLSKQYGTRLHEILAGAGTLLDLGEEIGDGLYAREVDYLVKNEWARFPDDILLRRTRVGLYASDETREKLAAYLERVTA